MIEPMNKVILLFTPAWKEPVLDKLQSLGYCHLDAIQDLPSATDLHNKKLQTERALSILRRLRKEKGNYSSPQPFSGQSEDWMARVLQGTEAIQHLDKELLAWKKKLEFSLLWGNVPYSRLEKLRGLGLSLRLYETDDHHLPELMKEAENNLEYLRKQGQHHLLLLLESPASSQKLSLYATEIPCPEETLEEIKDQIQRIEEERSGLGNWMNSSMKYIRALRNQLKELEDQIQYQKAVAALSDETPLLQLQLWLPRKHQRDLEDAFEKDPVYLHQERPLSTHEIPILLHQNALGRLFLPITRMFSLPAYTELDPTLFFAPFFTLYFSMCGADVGYGAMMLLGSLVLRIVSRNTMLKSAAILGIILSTTTLFAGVIYGTFFGQSLTEIAFLEPLAPFSALADQQKSFAFALFVGFVQLCVGYALRLINRVRQLGIEGLFYPLGILILLISLLFISLHQLSPEQIASSFPAATFILMLSPGKFLWLWGIVIAVLMVLGFHRIDQPWYLRPLTGLWELYSLLTGLPSDLLSYLRLFALGLSGALLGNAINQVALQIPHNEPWQWIFVVMVLIFGHGINLVLMLLSSFVHPLRLTFVEFYKSIDFQGGGRHFKPFKKNLPQSYT
jgi:V/A-type H+/Na+-transporting ATPase subunit I